MKMVGLRFKVVRASAPAKVILFGEHFVVYGEPAIVIAVDKRTYVEATLRNDNQIYINSVNLCVSGFFRGEDFQPEKNDKTAVSKLVPIKDSVERVLKKANKSIGVNIEIQSDIPASAGLGSSAAVASATAAAVGRLVGLNLSKEDVFNIALNAERIVHGTPSGIDPAISTYGGTILFQKDKGFTPLDVRINIPLVVGNTNSERSTGDLVAAVRRRRDNYRLIIDPIIEAGGEIALRAVDTLKKGDLKVLGELLNINHALLSAVGVSTEELDRLIYAARKTGAYGAKLTGGGGGGCMIALTNESRIKKVINAIDRAGGAAFEARKTDEGVRVES